MAQRYCMHANLKVFVHPLKFSSLLLFCSRWRKYSCGAAGDPMYSHIEQRSPEPESDDDSCTRLIVPDSPDHPTVSGMTTFPLTSLSQSRRLSNDLTTNSTINTYTGYFFSPVKNTGPLKKSVIWKSGTFCFIEQAFLTKYGLSGMSALWYR